MIDIINQAIKMKSDQNINEMKINRYFKELYMRPMPSE